MVKRSSFKCSNTEVMQKENRFLKSLTSGNFNHKNDEPFFLILSLIVDHRARNWPLMKSPLPTIAICFTYVIAVKFLGPIYMRNRQPFNIRWIMVFYNFAMVFISLLIFFKLGYHGWFGKYNYKCQPVDYSNSSDAIGVS